MYGSFSPFPPTYSCKMRYCETFTSTTGVAGVFPVPQAMSLNSLYDPDITGFGHQPYGYDQMTALYRRYLVSGVKVDITFTDPSADGMVCGVMVQSSGAGGSLSGIQPAIIKEQPLSWICPINNTGSQVRHFRQYLPLPKIEGLKRVQWIANQDQYGALVTASPTLQPTIQFAAASDAGSAGATLKCRIELTYYVRFYDRILQAYS